MKKVISLLLALVIILSTLGITVSAAETDANNAETTNIQPRLNGQKTIQLGNAWTDIKIENNIFYANLTVTNMTTSSEDVVIRVISIDRADILKQPATIAPGSSESFYGLAPGGYIIQGKSADDEVHTYELKYYD